MFCFHRLYPAHLHNTVKTSCFTENRSDCKVKQESCFIQPDWSHLPAHQSADRSHLWGPAATWFEIWCSNHKQACTIKEDFPWFTSVLSHVLVVRSVAHLLSCVLSLLHCCFKVLMSYKSLMHREGQCCRDPSRRSKTFWCSENITPRNTRWCFPLGHRGSEDVSWQCEMSATCRGGWDDAPRPGRLSVNPPQTAGFHQARLSPLCRSDFQWGVKSSVFTEV